MTRKTASKRCANIALEHWAQNGFANTDLDAQLKQHGISKLIMVGFIANSCVEATARFGMELGYHNPVLNNLFRPVFHSPTH